MENLTVLELWEQAWPGTSWLLASAEDRKLFLDHADSLAWYNRGRN